MISQRLLRRAAALEAAAALPYPHGSPRQIARIVLEVAEHFDAWLALPAPVASAHLVAGTPVDRNEPKGTTVSLVMPDNDKVTISMTGFDVEKVAVASDFTDPNGPYLAPFTWAVDNTALGELTVSADTLSVELASALGVVGTVAVTATDANGKVVPAFTVEIDPTAAVTAGLVAGTPVPRDAPAPAE